MFISVFLLCINLFTADSITLKQCQDAAIQNYPLLKQKQIIQNISRLKIQNLETAFYPQFSLVGTASYQSETLELPFKIPGLNMAEFPKDRSQAYLEITQMLYDGKANSVLRDLESAQSAIDKQNVETEIYKIKLQINQLYFSFLLLNQKEIILKATQTELESKIKNVESGFRNGILSESNLIQLKAESLKLDQKVIELESDRKNVLDLLNLFTDLKLDTNSFIKIPRVEITDSVNFKGRSEFIFFKLQTNKLTISEGLIRAKKLPKIFLFGQAGAGRPSPLNLFDTQFKPYWLVGVRFQWTIYHWKNDRREQQILTESKDMIEFQNKTLEKNLTSLIIKDKNEMNKLNEIIIKDMELISLQEKLITQSGSQLENGVITSSEYISVLNSIELAKTNLELHKLQLIQAKVSFQYNTGE